MDLFTKCFRWLGFEELKDFNIKQVSIGQLLFTFAVPALVLVLMAVVHMLYGHNITYMTRDIAVIANINPLAGFLSNFGVLLWCSTAAICFFTCIVLYHVKITDMFIFFFFSGLLSAYLLLDDFFMFHEELGPRYLGLNEKLIIILLGVSTLAYLLYFRKIILRQTNWFFLFLSLAFLGTSVFIDTIFYQGLDARIGFDWAFFLEDGAKWLGIASWCSYYLQTSYLAITTLCWKNVGEPLQTKGKGILR